MATCPRFTLPKLEFEVLDWLDTRSMLLVRDRRFISEKYRLLDVNKQKVLVDLVRKIQEFCGFCATDFVLLLLADVL